MPEPTTPQHTRGARTVATDPGSSDPRLRGLTTRSSFEDVWRNAITTAHSLRGWEPGTADRKHGTIEATVRSWIWPRPDAVTIRITLDPNGLTRVDLDSSRLAFRYGDRLTAQRIARFIRALSIALGT